MRQREIMTQEVRAPGWVQSATQDSGPTAVGQAADSEASKPVVAGEPHYHVRLDLWLTDQQMSNLAALLAWHGYDAPVVRLP